MHIVRGLYSRGRRSAVSALTPNRPADYTTVYDDHFTAGSWSVGGGGQNGATIGTKRVTVGSNGSMTSVADPSFSLSPDYLRVGYLFDFVHGASPGIFDAWGANPNGESNGDGRSYRRLYACSVFRMDPSNGVSWQMLAAFPGIKLGYYACASRATGGVGNQVLYFLEGDQVNEPNGDATRWVPVFVTQIDGMNEQQVVRPLAGLADPFPVKVNQVHVLETLIDVGDVGATVVGSSGVPPTGNGTLTTLLDGVPVIQSASVAFRNAAFPDGMWGRRGDFVLGGNLGTRKTRADYVRVYYEHAAVRDVVEGV